jgi:hypothetical protein
MMILAENSSRRLPPPLYADEMRERSRHERLSDPRLLLGWMVSSRARGSGFSIENMKCVLATSAAMREEPGIPLSQYLAKCMPLSPDDNGTFLAFNFCVSFHSGVARNPRGRPPTAQLFMLHFQQRRPVGCIPSRPHGTCDKQVKV